MKSIKQVAPLMRIVATIKSYCRQTADYRDAVENKSLSHYLKQHLSNPDWKFWQRLQPEQRAAFVYNQDALPDDAPSLHQFRLRLRAYKRAGYELFTFWCQAQATLRTDLPI